MAKKRDFLRPGKLVLDFGCKQDKVEGTLGVDIDPSVGPDLVCDLDRPPYPFKESSVDVVIGKQIMEHLGDLRKIFREIYRVMKHEGEVLVEVPHFSNFVSYAEPEHRHAFSYFLFDEIVKLFPCRVVKREITFHKFWRLWGIPFLANRFPETYERFWTFLFPAENLFFHIEVLKPPAS